MISYPPRILRLRLARRVVVAALLLGTLLAWPVAAWAHPLGNFTVNRYTRIELGGEIVRLRYIVDMAEIPAFQEQPVIDRNRDGSISEAERQDYIGRQLPSLRDGLQLRIDGQPVVLAPAAQQLEFPEGQGGLKTLRLTLDFNAALPNSQAESLNASYQDGNFAARLGWQEVVVRGEGLLESSAPAEDVSDELRNYPQDMLQSPLAVNSARFRFMPSAAACAGAACTLPAVRQATVRDPQSFDHFAELIAAPVLTPGTVVLALLLAFGLGAAHALTPGHGKTIVAAYLVGTRGTVRHAMFLGLTTTITHTAGVFGLGLITLLVSEFILPEQLYPWLGVISGALVFGIGVTLFRGRLRSFFLNAERRAQSAELLHHHDHSHDHSHNHNHDHAHSHGYLHDHGDGHLHSHLPPGGDGSAVTWRSLLALGVSGGLLPCPSALVVLLGAIALGRVGFGLLLIVAFSLGLAAVLTVIGVLLVYAGRLFERIPTRGPILRALPIASALLIAIVGVGITFQALLQTGIFRL